MRRKVASAAVFISGAAISLGIMLATYLQIAASKGVTTDWLTAATVDLVLLSLKSASLEAFGQWLSGVAGALALVWLVIAYIQSGRELALQADELTKMTKANVDQSLLTSRATLLNRLSLERSAAASSCHRFALAVFGTRLFDEVASLGGASEDASFVLFCKALKDPAAKLVIGEPFWVNTIEREKVRFDVLSNEARALDDKIMTASADAGGFRIAQTLAIGEWATARGEMNRSNEGARVPAE